MVDGWHWKTSQHVHNNYAIHFVTWWIKAWFNGCVALYNSFITELWKLCSIEKSTVIILTLNGLYLYFVSLQYFEEYGGWNALLVLCICYYLYFKFNLIWVVCRQLMSKVGVRMGNLFSKLFWKDWKVFHKDKSCLQTFKNLANFTICPPRYNNNHGKLGKLLVGSKWA